MVGKMLCLSYMYVVQYLVLKYVRPTVYMYVCYMFVLQVGEPQSENRLRNCFFVVVERLSSHPMFLQFASYGSIKKFVKPCSACVVLPCCFILLYVMDFSGSSTKFPDLRLLKKKSE